MVRIMTLLIGALVITIHTVAAADTIPVSTRSREAMLRVRPKLEKELRVKGFTWGAPLYMRIFKAEQVLEIWMQDGSDFRRFKQFSICTYGGQGIGPKTRKGDGRAPEGFYYITPGRLNPYSRYYLSFNLGYPNAYDRYHGRTGSALMVHGACVSIGCFAMTDAAMAQIYALAEASLQNGQPFFRVHIFPFRMTDTAMARIGHTGPNAFWENLKEGYDYFERHGQPPDVEVRNGRYLFH